jgi:NitT/TauT family transport system permease protein
MDERRLSLRSLIAVEAAIVVVLLLLWQVLPTIPWVHEHIHVLDPFVISSPSRVAKTLADLVTGANGQTLVWPYLRNTLLSTLGGTAIGVVAGMLAALALASSERLNQVVRPLIVAANAVPRIALIPIIVIVCGPSVSSSIVSCLLVVFFLVFFSAYEGARSVSARMVENVTLFGASKLNVTWQVRAPYAGVWTAAALPNALAFGLVAVVTAELLMGTVGMGRLLLTSVTNLDSSLTFAVVLTLSVIGIVLVLGVDLLRRRWLHWWGDGGRG